MRTLPSAATLNDRKVMYKLELEDSTGTLQNMRSFNGFDWVNSISYGEGTDGWIADMTVQLHREVANVSLAPLMNDPEPVSEAREVVLSIMVIAPSETEVDGTWEEVFRGQTRDIEWGGNESVIQMPCYDQGVTIARHFIKTVTTYGSSGGTAVETVIQNILDTEFGSGTYTLDVVGSPALTMIEEDIGLIRAGEIIQKIGPERQAWDLRHWWDESANAGAGGWVLRYQAPPRSKSVTDHSFSKGIAVRSVRRSADTVRNNWVVLWDESEDAVEAEDSTSIAKYGTETLFLDATNDPQLRTQALAQALADAGLPDTALAPVEYEVVIPFFPWVQLWDLFGFDANNVHFDSTQKLAVVGINHSLPQNPPSTTTLRLVSRPKGSVTRWKRLEVDRRTRDKVKEIGGAVEVPTGDAEITGISVGFDDSGKVIASATAGAESHGIIGTIGEGTTPTSITEAGNTTTSSSVSAGAGSIPVTDETGFAGFWCSISDGSAAEAFYVTTAGSGQLNISGSLDNGYSTGATVRRFVRRVADNAFGVRSRTGSVTADGSAPRPSVVASMGESISIIARGVALDGTLGPQAGPVRRRRGDAQFVPPRVTVQATRVGSDVSVSFTIEDPSLAAAANPSYKRRDGDNQGEDGSWLTAWDTSTGTAGSATTLTRAVTLSDPHTAIKWRVEWTDELGNTKTIGDELELATVQESAKEQFTHGAELLPRGSSVSNRSDFLMANGSAGSVDTFFGRAPVVDGVTITRIDVAALVAGSGTTTTRLKKGGTTLATVTDDGAATLSEQVSVSASYWWDVTLDGGGTVGDAAVSFITVEYSSPSFKQTY